MSGINCELDIMQDSIYDIYINRNRTLNQIFETYFLSGDTEYPFDFSVYSGATLEVRRNYGASNILIKFSTLDGSIILGTDGKFSLIKSAEELKVVRADQYIYDMYLSSAITPKRAFLSGRIIFKDYVTN